MGEVFSGLRAYGYIAVMWVRSSLAYRASFALTVFTDAAFSVLDFVAVLIMFSHIDALGGFSLPEVMFLYATVGAAMGLADMAVGSVEQIGQRVRDGSLDVMLLRPVPVLVQAAADRFALRRIGRLSVAALMLGWSVSLLEIDWSPAAVFLLPVMVVSGAAIFGAVFVLGACFQFLAKDAAQVQHAFTYGGATLLRYPPTIFAKELVRGVTFVVPLAFVNWLPSLRILGRDDPLGLPGWVDFASPLVAVACAAVAGLAWRASLRGYQSTGS